MRSLTFTLLAVAVGAVVFGLSRFVPNEYFFFAGYVVLQYIVLATAWNILGGYCGYVNFGTAALFALGAYSSVAIHKFHPMSMPVLIVIGGAVSAVVGLGIGYLTLRLRGAFFSIATLALAVVIQTLITNWDYVGGSRGAYVLRPPTAPLIGSYIQYLFLIMLVLAVAAIVVARLIERSRLGYGFATIRDDEIAAEASGVPTLHAKRMPTNPVAPVIRRFITLLVHQSSCTSDTAWSGNVNRTIACPPFTVIQAGLSSIFRPPASSSLSICAALGFCGDPISFHAVNALLCVPSIR